MRSSGKPNSTVSIYWQLKYETPNTIRWSDYYRREEGGGGYLVEEDQSRESLYLGQGDVLDLKIAVHGSCELKRLVACTNPSPSTTCIAQTHIS
jgi:hypothetical protein